MAHDEATEGLLTCFRTVILQAAFRERREVDKSYFLASSP